MTIPVSKATPYTSDQITEGMMSVIKNVGNVAEAARETGLPYDTLRKWCRNVYPDQFHRLDEQYGRETEEEIVRRARQNAREAADAVALGIEKAREQLESGQCRDPGSTTLALSKVLGTNIDKVLTLTGRPSSIQGELSMNELFKAMTASGVLRVSDPSLIEESVRPDDPQECGDADSETEAPEQGST